MLKEVKNWYHSQVRPFLKGLAEGRIIDVLDVLRGGYSRKGRERIGRLEDRASEAELEAEERGRKINSLSKEVEEKDEVIKRQGRKIKSLSNQVVQYEEEIEDFSRAGERWRKKEERVTQDGYEVDRERLEIRLGEGKGLNRKIQNRPYFSTVVIYGPKVDKSDRSELDFPLHLNRAGRVALNRIGVDQELFFEKYKDAIIEAIQELHNGYGESHKFKLNPEKLSSITHDLPESSWEIRYAVEETDNSPSQQERKDEYFNLYLLENRQLTPE